MGWSSGSGLCEDIVKVIDKRKDLTADQKESIYSILINHFENFDCDTLMEVNVKRFQKVLQQMRGSDEDV